MLPLVLSVVPVETLDFTLKSLASLLSSTVSSGASSSCVRSFSKRSCLFEDFGLNYGCGRSVLQSHPDPGVGAVW